MDKTPLSLLQQYWQHNEFRGNQEAIINAVLEGKDVLALLPTGGGKSICFQIPALQTEGVCLVISPLIALMKDQVNNLEKKGIPALSIHGGMSIFEVKETLQKAAYGDCKFLYLSPERLETNVFLEYLPAININLIAVDEAHCISQWGYDFRPPYLRIAQLRKQISYDVAVLALTASATPVVQKDIVDKLEFEKGYEVFTQSFLRPNISYSVFKADSKINKALEVLNNVPGSSIVYCKSRKQTREVAQLLSYQNIRADFYHAGLTQDERNTKQQNWISNTTRVMVCTNAFGMGIDKPDVRTVIHFDTPDCLENYYQEAGRAGRDGKRAFAVLIYHQKDMADLQALPDQRFPSIEVIKNIYQHLSDFLELPVGIGEGEYFDFDLKLFVKNFNLDAYLVVNALKALEHEGFLTFSDSIFLPSKLVFVADKNSVAAIQESQPALEPLIKCLLRTYEGIFDNIVSISEKLLSRLMQVHPDIVMQQLQQLKAFGIVNYLPQKETPQIHYSYNRAPAQYLNINNKAYLLRKENFKQRVQTITDYLQLTHLCRSRYIANYFGDVQSENCGVCDNCLGQKSLHISKEEFENIVQHFYSHITAKGIDITQLKLASKHIHKNKFWKVLDYLQQERKVKSTDGIIQLI